MSRTARRIPIARYANFNGTPETLSALRLHDTGIVVDQVAPVQDGVREGTAPVPCDTPSTTIALEQRHLASFNQDTLQFSLITVERQRHYANCLTAGS